MLRRVDGDGPERVKRVHARLYGHTGAERQILLRDDRAVGDDRHVAARTAEDAGRFPRLVADLHLGRKVERRADRHAQPGLCQLVRDQMPLGRMLERQANAEFVGDADGGEDIIRAVRVRLERDLPTQDGDERLKLHIECGLPEHIVPGGLFFLQIQPRLHQRLAQDRRRRHPRRVALGGVAALRVLAERAFHRGFLFDDHVVDARSGRLDGGKGAAEHVRAARAGAYAGDAGAARVDEALVHRVHAVDGAQLRAADVVALVDIHARLAVAVEADVAVRVHKAGIDLQPRRVDRLLRVQVGADLQELPVFDQDIGRVRLAVYRVVDAAVFDTKHVKFLPFCPDPAFVPGTSIADAAA